MRANPSKGWRTRLAACDWQPESFLILARVLAEVLDRLASDELAKIVEQHVIAQPPVD